MTRSNNPLLGEGDPAPVMLFNAGGSSPFLIVGDHAGNAIPRALGDLGLTAAERMRHIAWDIGVEALGCALATALDAAFIFQPYSRLVIDCNRDPGHPDAAAARADGSLVPGNVGLTADRLAARITAVHAPYHDRIALEIARRHAARRRTIYIALHSFTPILGGHSRPWHAGILHDGEDARFAMALLAALGREKHLIVGDNEPYRMDATDYSVPHHAYPARLAYAEIEIRQDLLADAAGVSKWAKTLEAACRTAMAMSVAPRPHPERARDGTLIR